MNIKPTNSELEILQVVWKRGSATVREVNDELSKDKGAEIGYTTTLKFRPCLHLLFLRHLQFLFCWTLMNKKKGQ